MQSCARQNFRPKSWRAPHLAPGFGNPCKVGAGLHEGAVRQTKFVHPGYVISSSLGSVATATAMVTLPAPLALAWQNCHGYTWASHRLAIEGIGHNRT